MKKYLFIIPSLLILGSLCLAPRAHAAVTVVQAASNGNNSSGQNDLVATFGSNVTAGDAIIVWAQGGIGSQPTYVGSNVVDGEGDTFTLLKQVNDGTNGQYGGLWFVNSSTGGSKTVTYKGSTLGASYSTVTVYEVSGLSASASDTGNSNVHASGGSSSTNGDTAGSFTTTQTGDLIIAGFFNDNGAGSSWTAGTSPVSFTIPAGATTSLGSSNPHAMEYAVWGSSGAMNPAITLGAAGGYIAIGWSFKAASATPTVTTDSFSHVGITTANASATLVSDGAASTTDLGLVWGTSANPTTANNKISVTPGIGQYYISITGLSAGTTYHIRAYGTNSMGTSYGSDLSFTTETAGATSSTYNASTTWTAPENISGGTIQAECWGGGGGGGGASSNNTGGGGGGGGGYAKENTAPVVAGTTYNIVIGNGGAGGAAGANNGVAGGDSWFNTSSTVWARGGGFGSKSGTYTGGAGGASSTAVGDVKYAGGAGGAGAASKSGGGGGAAGNAANGGTGGQGLGGSAGSGGSTGGGAGGAGGASNSAGNPGTAPGGGGGGGERSSANKAGGAGADGRCILTYTIAAPASPPDATSASTTINSDGARSGDTITITGTNFGTVSANNRATCNGGASTGCIEFINGGDAIVATSSISSWTSTGITFTVSSTLASNGGSSALQVWAAGVPDLTPLTYYIYPKISTVLSLAGGARTYNAADTDGLVEVTGDHFGALGTSTVLTYAATIHGTTGGSCATAGYTSSTVCLEVPSTIPTSTYSGNIILNRASDNKQATTSLGILPRILSLSPTNASAGNVVQILGDHLCQGGTCPVYPNRASATNNVAFGNVTSSDAVSSDFLAETGGAGACNGSGAAWTDGEICVQVPTAASAGSASTTVTSNGNASNIFSFTVNAPSPPGAPGTPTFASITSSTLTVSWTAASGGVSYYTPQRSTSSAFAAPTTLATTTATSTNDSGLTANTTYYYRVKATNGGGDSSWSASSSVLTLPDVPGANSYSNVSTSTLTISWSAPATGATFYLIQHSTSSVFSASTTLATTTATTTNDSGLTPNTTYYYHVQAWNATGGGAFNATSSVTTAAVNSSPNAPTQDSPANAAQDQLLSPVFKMTATDPESNALQYKVTIYSNGGCTTVLQTNDESASQTGWSGQNTSSSKEYTSGTQGVFTTQIGLAQNTTYYWKASAKDPEGSNGWTDSASCNSFYTTFGNWTTDSGSWSISGNQLVVTPASGASVQLHVSGSSQTNGIIEFEGKSSAVGSNTGNIGGVVRADTGANRYQVTSGDFLNQQAVIAKTLSGSYSTIATTPLTFSGNTMYHFRGSISGTTLKAWVNGASALAPGADSSLSSAGFFGLAASSTNGSATFTFDDLAFYASTVITMTNLPVGGSWSVLNHSGTVLACQTGSTWDLSTYSGQVPIDYDSGGGGVSVWTNNTCSGAAAQTYSGADIFGGDTYVYTPASTSTPPAAGTVATTTTITISQVGAISF